MVTSAVTGSAARLAHAYYMRSVAFTSVGDSVNGMRFAEMACTAASDSGSPSARAQALYATGVSLTATNPEEATALLQEAADVACHAGNRWIQAFALTEVLWLEASQGRPREALQRYADVIELWYRGGDWANQWLSLRHVFGILVQLRADLGAGRSTALSLLLARPMPFPSGSPMPNGSVRSSTNSEIGWAVLSSLRR